MQVQINAEQKDWLSEYIDNKEVADKVLKVVQSRQLSYKETEDIFDTIISLFEKAPAIPAGTEIIV